MALLEHPLLQIPYVQSVLVVIAAILLSSIFTVVMTGILTKWAKKTKTNFDDLLIEALQKPVWFLIILLGIKIALVPIQITGGIVDTIILSVIILTVTWLIVRVVDSIIGAWGHDFASKTKSKLDDELLPLLHKSSRIIFWILGFLMILKQWGVEITPLLASLGILGLALGFAIKDTLANIFGGISLIMDKVYVAGDIVKLDSGVLGTVTEIGLRSTRIKTFDNKIVNVPNGNLAVSNIENWMQPNNAIRISIIFGVEYGSSIQEVKKLVMGLINKNKRVSKKYDPQIMFIDMADSALILRARFFVDKIEDKLPAEDEMRTKIYDALNKAKIGIPFPQRTLHFADALNLKKGK